MVSGELGQRFEGRFLHLTAEIHPGRTLLRGVVADQAELRAVLEQLFDLGMEVVSLQTGARARTGPSG